MPLHDNTSLPIQLCLNVVTVVQVCGLMCTNTLSWPWNLEQSGTHSLSRDVVVAMTTATLNPALKSHRVGKPDTPVFNHIIFMSEGINVAELYVN